MIRKVLQVVGYDDIGPRPYGGSENVAIFYVRHGVAGGEKVGPKGLTQRAARAHLRRRHGQDL